MLSFFTKPRIQGGVHAEERKAATASQAIVRNFPLPEKLYIPLQQHVGKPAEPLIRVGDKVLKGPAISLQSRHDFRTRACSQFGHHSRCQ